VIAVFEAYPWIPFSIVMLALSVSTLCVAAALRILMRLPD
jgi:hypothetical protein